MVYYVGNMPCGDTYLMHYGRLGMKWGQHIFADEKSMGSASAVAKSSANVFKSASEMVGRASRRRTMSRKFKSEVSSLSDDELRKRVNRMNLERQYAQLTGADMHRGAEISREVLQTAGSIIGIASGALTTAMLVKKLRG